MPIPSTTMESLMPRMLRSFIIGLSCVLGAGSAFALEPVSGGDPLSRRMDQLCTSFTPMPGGLDTMFTNEFIKAVPIPRLLAGIQQLQTMAGTCTGWALTKREGEWAASTSMQTSGGYTIPVDIRIESQPPHRISGLMLRPPSKNVATMDSLLADLKTFPGTTSLHAVNLTKGTTVASWNPDAVLPLGSTFKLYILGELVRSVDAGQHRWDEVIALDSNRFSLPSGILQKWPHGAPVTLHTLASLMISISDNTATDHLLLHLGRNKVEAIQSVMGHRQPGLNSPFMTTRDMFLIKFSEDGSRAQRYASLDAKQRMNMLEKEIVPLPLSDVAMADKVVMPDKVEWFATTPDLTKAMNWLRMQADKPKLSPLLGVLGINKGVTIDEHRWSYAGYKGGSEPGVINMTYLLRATDGDWYSISCSWMNTKESVDEARFAGIVQKALELLR